MKLHASRYGVTAVMGAVLSGIFCLAVIPFEQKGD